MSAHAESISESRGVIIWTSLLPDPPEPDLVERFGVFPLEFHHSALHAGFDLVRGDTLPLLRAALRAARAQGRKVMIFVYSLRPYDVLALALYAHTVPIVIYYQNIAPALLPWRKRLFVTYALRRARLVLVQDTRRLASFSREQGAHRTRFFPWIVDDVFFKPVPGIKHTKTLFVPGDRGRLDDLVIEIARRTGRHIVRVSRYYPPRELAAYQACELIDLRYYVRWETLLHLYQETAMVLNVTDDAETSAGMTSFLEGLAMNALVLTPAGHSSAGYEFADGFKPYITIAQPRSVDAWVEAIEAADRHPRDWPAGRTPRDLFLQLSGMAASSQRWRELFAEVTA
ncbi:hypothetical protein [Rariglobus hedericola]|uniref:Glycosyltransferase family 4 protein n=1 Tax=Rariglobus hedericola TaxID=2597822 RepID=A0A556QPX7_9BACT|nr:hypothetical protein [Rariglobus hedericola]TSJ78687.1 hypothetical protein FPL22_05110 [Rariglobus hedericola]